MSLATLLDRNKAFAATGDVAKNLWVPKTYATRRYS